MPIKVADLLPATGILENENIFVMTEFRAMHQDIRPLDVLILNLMPTKEVTETQLLRKLSNTPLQVNVEFLQTASYTPVHTDSNHMEAFYTTFDQIRNRKFDGMIITGAPLDHVRFEKVAYWDEICTIMEWGRTHVHCTLHLCWGAYAALYHFYGLDREDLDVKLSGVYPHRILKRKSPLFRGFDDIFYAPQSRAMTIAPTQIASVPGILHYARKFLQEDKRPSVLREKEDFDGADLTDAAKEGDAIAMKTLDYCMGHLARGLAIAAHIIDPDIFLIGGGMTAAHRCDSETLCDKSLSDERRDADQAGFSRQ